MLKPSLTTFGGMVKSRGADPITHHVKSGTDGFFPGIAGSHEGDKMTAGGTAKSPDTVRIEPIHVGVLAQPTNGGVAVIDLARPLSSICQAITDAGDSEAIGGEEGSLTIVL